MYERKKELETNGPFFTFVYFLFSTFCFRTMILCLSLRNRSVSPILSSWEYSSYLLLYSPPSQLCTSVNTELGCRAFTCSSSSPLYIFFSYYTFTYLLYLSVGIQTCRGAPEEVRGWLREGSQSSPPPCESWGLSSSLRASTFPSWAISPAPPLYSKCISCKQHIVKSAFACVCFVIFTVLRVEPGALYLASKSLASEPYAQLFSWWWFLFWFLDGFLLRCPCCHRTHSVTQEGLELVIFLSQS